MNNLSNKLIAEFLGTLFFVTASLMDHSALAPAATLCLCVFAMGHISGGHFNPAVSAAVFLRGRMSRQDLIHYAFAQFAGAVLASIIARMLNGAGPENPPGLHFGKGVLGEFLGTFLLVTTVLHVTTTRSLANNQFYGLAIGLSVIGGSAMASASSGALNPAAGLGIVLSGQVKFMAIFVYLIGCLGGGAVAAIVFRIMLPNEHMLAVTGPSKSTPPPSPAG